MIFPEVTSQMKLKNNKMKMMDNMGVNLYISGHNKSKTIRKYMNQRFKMNQTNNTVINMSNKIKIPKIFDIKMKETVTKCSNNKMIKVASIQHPNKKINKKI